MSSIFGCATSCNNCGEPIHTQLNVIIPSGQTVIVDQLAIADFDAIQWNLLITDTTQNKRKFQAVFATHELGITPFHNIFARTGSKKQDLLFDIDVQIVLGSFRLIVTNNSLVDYLGQVNRFPVENFTP